MFFRGLTWLSVVGRFPPSKKEPRSPEEATNVPVVSEPASNQTNDSTLTSDDIRALQFLAGEDWRSYFVKDVATALSMKKPRAQYHLDRLVNTRNARRSALRLLLLGPFLRRASRESGGVSYWITATGRDTLMKRGLL
jgi:hypothetical protein